MPLLLRPYEPRVQEIWAYSNNKRNSGSQLEGAMVFEKVFLTLLLHVPLVGSGSVAVLRLFGPPLATRSTVSSLPPSPQFHFYS